MLLVLTLAVLPTALAGLLLVALPLLILTELLTALPALLPVELLTELLLRLLLDLHQRLTHLTQRVTGLVGVILLQRLIDPVDRLPDPLQILLAELLLTELLLTRLAEGAGLITRLAELLLLLRAGPGLLAELAGLILRLAELLLPGLTKLLLAGLAELLLARLTILLPRPPVLLTELTSLAELAGLAKLLLARLLPVLLLLVALAELLTLLTPLAELLIVLSHRLTRFLARLLDGLPDLIAVLAILLLLAGLPLLIAVAVLLRGRIAHAQRRHADAGEQGNGRCDEFRLHEDPPSLYLVGSVSTPPPLPRRRPATGSMRRA